MKSTGCTNKDLENYKRSYDTGPTYSKTMILVMVALEKMQVENILSSYLEEPKSMGVAYSWSNQTIKTSNIDEQYTWNR